MKYIYKKEPMLTREEKRIQKGNRVLSSICKECGREKAITRLGMTSFCKLCWKDMQITINGRD